LQNETRRLGRGDVRIVLGVLLLAAMAEPVLAQVPKGQAGTYYVVTTPLTAYAKADVKSEVVDKIAPLTYVAVQELLPGGWIRFKIRKASAGILDLVVDPDKSTFDAYVRAESDDNYVAADGMDAVRIEKVAKTTWPTAVKNDVARKRVQIGFTEEQVLLALGEPDRRESPLWVYSRPFPVMRAGKTIVISERRVTFANGVVQNVSQK
jgi:hypothetical protein